MASAKVTRRCWTGQLSGFAPHSYGWTSIDPRRLEATTPADLQVVVKRRSVILHHFDHIGAGVEPAMKAGNDRIPAIFGQSEPC